MLIVILTVLVFVELLAHVYRIQYGGPVKWLEFILSLVTLFLLWVRRVLEEVDFRIQFWCRRYLLGDKAVCDSCGETLDFFLVGRARQAGWEVDRNWATCLRCRLPDTYYARLTDRQLGEERERVLRNERNG